MIITVTGENKHRVQAEIKSVIDSFTKQHGSLAVERFDAGEADVEHILSAVSGVSLLSDSKLVVIYDFDANKALTENAEQLITQVPGDTIVLVVINRLDKRLSYGKLLRKGTDFREFNALKPHEVVTWVIQATKEKGGQIDRATANYLTEVVGTNQERLSNELDKLILHSPTVTRQTIDTLSERQLTSTTFDLLEAGFNGRQNRALELYDQQRRQQVEPLSIIGMIGWQLHILALSKTAGTKSAAEIARDSAVHPFVVQKSLLLAKNMTLGKIKHLVHQAVVLEEKLKSRTMNADDAVKHFLLSL